MEMTILAMSALGFIAAVVAPIADVSFGSFADVQRALAPGPDPTSGELPLSARRRRSGSPGERQA
jgi:hypothetical protein